VNNSSKVQRIRAALFLVLAAATQAGCYVLQSAEGQLSLMARREPISRVIKRPTTSPALRTQLEEVTAIRNFASRHLGLPDNGSYRSYADVGRRYVVWNVVAAPEFSLDAKQCVSRSSVASPIAATSSRAGHAHSPRNYGRRIST
jgi:predicted aminopeptidase